MDAKLTVIVRATDPAGIPQADPAVGGNSAEITVTITITDVNEPPVVTGMDAVSFGEVRGQIADPLDEYSAIDPEVTAITAWSVAGADGGKFEISSPAGGLTFKVKPDYEMPTDTNMDNVYEVTVRTADADGYIGMKAVKVTVENENEPGVVTLSKTQPRVGIAVKASLTDPDGGISGLSWQWSINGNIAGANSDTYTPKTEDIDDTLTATASYFDGASDPDATDKGTATAMSANAVALDTRNRPPVFADQDTEIDGVQNESTERKVEENAEADSDNETADNVGRPVKATDPDPNIDPLTYTLGGTDKDSFTVTGDGQIEVGAGTKLDYETKQTYMVTVMAEDSFGASASIVLTIKVTDLDEDPEITRAPDANVAPEFASATTSRTVAENTAAGEDIGNPVAANDANGDTLGYTLGGADAASFDIDPATGQLMTLDALDYETKPTYSVTVTASDSGGLSDSTAVTITVTKVDEGIEVSGPAAVDYAENGTNPVATYTATGPESATMTWSVDGDDAGDFEISTGGVLTFKSSPDHENPTDMGMDNVYMVTVMADDGTNMDSHDVMVTVTNVEDDAMPPAGTELERLIASYDTNGNSTIEKVELFNAINEYLFGPWDSLGYTKTGLFALINEYLFG